MKTTLLLLALPVAALLLPGCSGDSEESAVHDYAKRLSPEEIAAAEAYKHPLADAYYAENPEFFRFSKPEDLPQDLKWENGMDQPDLGSSDAKKGGAVNLLIPDFPRTLRAVGPDSNGSFRKFFHDEHDLKAVMRHPGTGGYFPGLSTEWAIAPDNKTIYLKLDPNARYTDGVTPKADDYFFLFYFMRSPWLKAPWYENWYNEKYTHVTKYDDFTIAIGLSEAKPDPLRFFEEDVYPLPRHVYKDFGEDYVEKYTWRFIPSTGPYAIYQKDIKKGRSITQTRLEDWWAKDKKFFRYRFNPDRRVFGVTRDPDKALEAFLKGDYDLWRVRVPEVWHDKLDKPPVQSGYVERAQFDNQTPRPCWSLRINKSKPVLDNQDVRVGLQFATDWDLVIKEFFRGDYQRMETSSDGYGEFSNPDVTSRRYDVQKALESFGKAGFSQRGPDGILVNSEGARLSFNVSTGYKKYKDVLTILEQQARKAGVEFQIEVLDSTSGWKKAQEKKHEICFAALNRSVELYPRYHDFWHSFNAFEDDGSLKTNTNNLTVHGSPEFDALIDRYESSTDLAEIKSIAHQLEVLIHDDGSFIPGWVRPYYRVAYWRWIRWPEHMDYKLSREYDEFSLYWIDEEIRQGTEAAMKTGKTFEPVTAVFDQHKNQ